MEAIRLPDLTIDFLTELHKQWSSSNHTERFGQYVIKRSRIEVDQVNGITIANEPDPLLAYAALIQYIVEKNDQTS